MKLRSLMTCHLSVRWRMMVHSHDMKGAWELGDRREAGSGIPCPASETWNPKEPMCVIQRWWMSWLNRKQNKIKQKQKKKKNPKNWTHKQKTHNKNNIHNNRNFFLLLLILQNHFFHASIYGMTLCQAFYVGEEYTLNFLCLYSKHYQLNYHCSPKDFMLLWNLA